MAATVTSKGQVTIPKPVRDRFGIEPGSMVEFELAPDERIVLVKAKAGKGLNTDQILALTRGET